MDTEYDFVQRSPDAGPPEDFEQRPPLDLGPRQFVQRGGGGGPVQSANAVPDEGSADMEKLLSTYGVKPNRRATAPRRED